jgi:RHS repeat-associated protein
MTQEYFATYEVASANLENLFFEKIDEVRDDKPGSTWNGDLKSARLNGADPTRVTGTSALLKVMAGDKVEMNVNNYFENYDPGQDTPLQPGDLLASIISTLTGGQGGTLPGENHDTKLVDRTFTQGNYSIFDQIVQNNTDPSKPKASLNYILFDENMQIIPGSSGLFQANGNGTWTTIGTTTPMVMPVNGYLAVYLNNASQISGCLSCSDVFFDQLVLRFTRGNLKEEAHYYPHGLPIAGMGSAAHGFVENRRKYQGNEYIKDLGLNWMDFQARQYDPQLGRFLAVDPLADEKEQVAFSPYAAMGNNPGMTIDPDGRIITNFQKLLTAPNPYYMAAKIATSSELFMSFLSQFVSLEKGDDLGFGESGAKSWLNINYSLVDNDYLYEDAHTFIQVFDGKKWTDITEYEGTLTSKDVGKIRIQMDLTNSSEMSSADKALNITHETLVHAQYDAEMISKFKDGRISFTELKNYKLNIGTSQHDRVYLRTNELYEKVNDQIQENLNKMPRFQVYQKEHSKSRLGTYEFRNKEDKSANKEGYVRPGQAWEPARVWERWYYNPNNSNPLKRQ